MYVYTVLPTQFVTQNHEVIKHYFISFECCKYTKGILRITMFDHLPFKVRVLAYESPSMTATIRPVKIHSPVSLNEDWCADNCTGDYDFEVEIEEDEDSRLHYILYRFSDETDAILFKLARC
jgi:hypothetical protein